MQKKSSSLDDGEEKCFLNLYITNGFINEKTKNSSPYFSSYFKTPIYENKKEKKNQTKTKYYRRVLEWFQGLDNELFMTRSQAHIAESNSSLHTKGKYVKFYLLQLTLQL